MTSWFRSKQVFLLIVLFGIFSSSSLFASDLVDFDWVKAHKNTIKIIDLRSEEVYQSGHIPLSINVPLSEFTRSKNNTNGFVETPKAFKALMQRHGIKNTDTLLLYSDWSFLESMRVYWVMDFYGHKTVKVLDGGFQSWSEQDGEISMDELSVTQSQYFLEINASVITTKFRTFMASKNSDYVIVDGRNNKQYEGAESLTERKGHIPNAINVPWVNLIKNRDASDKFAKLKTPSNLEDIAIIKEKLSLIPKDKKIILYCNGGQESSVLYFALKELGVKAAVYDGSWFEWSGDSKMPVELGAL